MSEKSCDFLTLINFETKPSLFTFMSTYLIFVLFCATVID